MNENIGTRIMIVALDGSPSSLSALHWASKSAELLNLKIEAVNVWEYAESPLDIAGVGFGSNAYVGESDPKIWSDQILKESIGSVFGPEADHVRATSVEGGVVRTLVEMSKGAQLLVMGSRGHGKLADLILGSVSESCAAKSKCPVVIVHAPA
jgi:nucleotide-binding universal stress UspA family protein